MQRWVWRLVPGETGLRLRKKNSCQWGAVWSRPARACFCGAVNATGPRPRPLAGAVNSIPASSQATEQLLMFSDLLPRCLWALKLIFLIWVSDRLPWSEPPVPHRGGWRGAITEAPEAGGTRASFGASEQSLPRLLCVICRRRCSITGYNSK